MANKPRMGSDPFQKKDPLDWIGGGETSNQEQSSQQSKPSNPSTPSKRELPQPQRKSGKQNLPPPGTHSDIPNTSQTQPERKSTKKGLRPGWTRATFIVREVDLQNLKAVAYWDRKELKRVVDEAFNKYLSGKEVPPVPLE
ncbi:MAG: hypothetical protein P8018_08780 [Acidobacteriota bacterium]